jgi:hypothetical protein
MHYSIPNPRRELVNLKIKVTYKCILSVTIFLSTMERDENFNFTDIHFQDITDPRLTNPKVRVPETLSQFVKPEPVKLESSKPHRGKVLPKKNARILDIIHKYKDTRNKISEVLAVSPNDPAVFQKLHLENWYSGNNQISLANLTKIVEQVRFEKSIDSILNSSDI